MRYKLLICLGAIAGSFGCKAQTTIKPTDPHIHYMGRVNVQDTAAVISWPGTSLTINFNGTGVKTLINDERGDNYFNIVVDGKVTGKLHPSAGKNTYTLASGLPAGKHQLVFFKRTEWENGKTWFYNFTLDNGGEILPGPKTKKRKIEYFGDSITSGYAMEDSTGQDRGTGTYKDNYLSYAALTARHFDAEYYCTSKSGIGITVSWFPLIMPEMYDRLDATDPNSKWDFSKYTPDVVVINLFQNDSWIVTHADNEQFKARFGSAAPNADFIINAYANFLKSVRGKYPKAQIICALGNMDATKTGSAWPGYIQKAVDGLNDKNIHAHFFPYKNTPGHPNVKEQQAMADDLIGYIEGNVKW